jgi:predicted RNA binding protein YcfA (HicA-like mRNA interferase family)
MIKRRQCYEFDLLPVYAILFLCLLVYEGMTIGMPREIRELRADLQRAGYRLVKRQGKGSHTKWRYPFVPGSVLVSGHDGDDAKPYQESDVREAIRKAHEAEKRQQA